MHDRTGLPGTKTTIASIATTDVFSAKGESDNREGTTAANTNCPPEASTVGSLGPLARVQEPIRFTLLGCGSPRQGESCVLGAGLRGANPIGRRRARRAPTGTR